MKEVEFMRAYFVHARDFKALGSSNQGQTNVQSWEREVERAQMANWFHAAPKPGCHVAGGASQDFAVVPIFPPRQEAGVKNWLFRLQVGEHTSSHRPSGAGVPWPRGLSVHEIELSSAQTAVGFQPTSVDVMTQARLLEVLRAAVIDALPVGASRTSRQEHVETASASDADALGAMHKQSAHGQATAEDVRIHAQWYGNGVQVWLGVRGGVFGGDQTRVTKMVAELRRLVERGGDTLTEVICNGRTIYQSAHSSTPDMGVVGLL